jgi:hypothetical protein
MERMVLYENIPPAVMYDSRSTRVNPHFSGSERVTYIDGRWWWKRHHFHGRSTLTKRIKIKMKERKRSLRLKTQESWTCQMFRSSDAEGSNRGM